MMNTLSALRRGTAIRRFSSGTQKKILGRHSIVPQNLLLITGTSGRVALHEKAQAAAKNSLTFDFKASKDGLLQPAPLDDTYIGRNGIAVYAPSELFYDLAATRAGSINITEIPEGTALPADVVLLHEREHVYSLQTTVPIKPEDFAAKITEMVRSFPSHPRKEYFAKHPYSI